jgi:hypothetical protein
MHADIRRGQQQHRAAAEPAPAPTAEQLGLVKAELVRRKHDFRLGVLAAMTAAQRAAMDAVVRKTVASGARMVASLQQEAKELFAAIALDARARSVATPPASKEVAALLAAIALDEAAAQSMRCA